MWLNLEGAHPHIAVTQWVPEYALAYEAGSELNDEDCSNIPGPYGGGAALSDEDGEGNTKLDAHRRIV